MARALWKYYVLLYWVFRSFFYIGMSNVLKIRYNVLLISGYDVFMLEEMKFTGNIGLIKYFPEHYMRSYITLLIVTTITNYDLVFQYQVYKTLRTHFYLPRCISQWAKFWQSLALDIVCVYSTKYGFYPLVFRSQVDRKVARLAQYYIVQQPTG